MKSLEDLPQFTIAAVEPQQDGTTLLRGRFNHLTGIYKDLWAWFYRFESAFTATVVELGEHTQEAIYRVDSSDVADNPVTVDENLTWVSAYWDPYVLDSVLDRNREWRKRTFRAEDAIVFKQGSGPMPQVSMRVNADGSKCWSRVSDGVPAGVTEYEIVPSYWDHEHCSICNRRVNDADEFFESSENDFVCPGCYERYVVPHDLSFI